MQNGTGLVLRHSPPADPVVANWQGLPIQLCLQPAGSTRWHLLARRGQLRLSLSNPPNPNDDLADVAAAGTDRSILQGPYPINTIVVQKQLGATLTVTVPEPGMRALAASGGLGMAIFSPGPGRKIRGF